MDCVLPLPQRDHYQDYAGNEMDAVIELPDGRWCGIEIKLGANKIEEAAPNLIHIRRGSSAWNAGCC